MSDKDKDPHYQRLYGWTRHGSRPQTVYVLRSAVISAAALEFVELFKRIAAIEKE